VASAAAVALALTVAGCTHQAMLLGEPVPKGCAAKAAIGSERCMGWYIDRLKMLEHDEYDDPELARYVSSVGERLVRASGDHRAWTFRVIDDGDPQAGANLSPIVYIARGALARMRDEAELAGMLGHEIGHILAGHARDLVIERNRGLRDSTWDLRSQRDDELQADELAVLLTQRAGYDPHAVESMLRALAAGEPPDDPDHGSDPHPRWTERLARIQAFAMHFRGGERRAQEYLAHIENLVVDVDPRNWYATDGTIVFARVGVALHLPDGWLSTFATSDDVGVNYTNGLALHLSVMPARGKPTIKPNVAAASYFETVEGNGRLLVINVEGFGGDLFAKQLRAAVRPARPDEVAMIRPRRIDLSKPRTLWPDPLPADEEYRLFEVTSPRQ